MIEVEDLGSDRFRVTVSDGGSSSRHAVTVPGGYVEELGLGDVDVAALVEESFRFLLEREPKESIMSSFELGVIARYFPEYPREIRERMGS